MSSDMMPKRRGRPRKNPLPETAPQVKEKEMSDDDLLALIISRFDALAVMTRAMSQQKVRGAIISGAPGIGKTHTVNGILESYKAKGDVNFVKVSGFMTPIMLYRLLYEYRKPTDVVMVDDCDSIFYNDDASNILKAALDLGEKRELSYRSATLNKGEDDEDEVPESFVYEGSMIFTTNIDFDAFLAAGRNRMTPHIKALRDRCFYLDMKLHGERAVALWIRHMLTTSKMLMKAPHNLSADQSKDILDYLMRHRDRIPVLSLRTAVKAATLVNIDAKGWQALAAVTLTT